MSGTVRMQPLDLSHISFAGAPAPARRAAAPAPRPPAPPASALLDDILRRAALRLDAYLPAVLQRRLPACLRRLRVLTQDEARARLEADPRRWPEVLDALLIGVTEFFRDRTVFARLAERVVPEILLSRQRIRVLSAGCSDGSELTSVALLLAEAGALDRADLLGVDVRPTAVRRAAAGVFDRAASEAVGPALLDRYFTVRDKDAVVQPALRARLRWCVGDLFRLPARGPFDLVLFRNVAIYLREEAARDVWTALTDLLAPGGWLVTGKAEIPPAGLPFKRVDACVYRRVRA